MALELAAAVNITSSSFPFPSFILYLARTLPPAVRIKCSFDYTGAGASSSNNALYEYERYAAASPQYPRPPEIQWKKELCNSVQLIGVLGAPIQIKHLASGKFVAWSRLAVKKSQTDTVWINLTFWDELAHIASQHVETGKRQSSYSANSTGSTSTEELWQAFFANPKEWWDNRKNKQRSPNYPDLKHKDTGEALWVESRCNPPWVKSQLSILDSKMQSFNDRNSGLHVNFKVADSFGPF